LVPAGDPIALAQAAISLLTDRAEARKMAARAAQVAARFTIQNAIPCYEGVYRRVVRPKRLLSEGG